jgi:hypothetical protein
MINQFPDMDTYFTEINHVLLASRGYEYDGFLDFLYLTCICNIYKNLCSEPSVDHPMNGENHLVQYDQSV